MLRTEITQKALRDGNTYYCGYCDIADAVAHLPEIGYNYGVYGWNSTAYACGNVVLVTGYRPAGWQRLTSDECERLNAAARNARRIPGIEAEAERFGLTPEYMAICAEMAHIRRERSERGPA